MPASSTSSLSTRSSDKNSSCSSNSNRRSSGSRDSKLLLRAESDFAETASMASSTSSWTTSSRSKLFSASLTTSCASLRGLELRKSQIELELARVQQELQLRESQHAAAPKPYSTSASHQIGGRSK